MFFRKGLIRGTMDEFLHGSGRGGVRGFESGPFVTCGASI